MPTPGRQKRPSLSIGLHRGLGRILVQILGRMQDTEAGAGATLERGERGHVAQFRGARIRQVGPDPVDHASRPGAEHDDGTVQRFEGQSPVP